MLALILSVAIAIMTFWPRTPLALLLNRVLVEAPLRLLSQVERKHLFFFAILLTLGLTLMMAGPLDLALVGIWDIAAYLDVATAVFVVAAVAKGRSAWLLIKDLASTLIARRTARRPKRRAVRSRSRRADDDPGRGPVFAFA